MRILNVKITGYEKGAIVFDEFGGKSEYSSTIDCDLDGCKLCYSGTNKDSTIEDIKKIAEPRLCFDEWFEENWTKSFEDYDLPAPIITTEEGETSQVNSIDDFINNCKGLMPISEYNKVKDSLVAISQSEYKVKWIE